MRSNDYCGAGRLDRKAQVMGFQETSPGTWEWVPVRDIWISLDLRSDRTTIFSKLGVGARSAAMVAWKQDITLHHAIRQGDMHLFLTSITERNRNQMDIQGALVEITQCEDKYTDTTFPAIVTEQYHHHVQLDPQATNIIRHVLVTPKPIQLILGRLVEVGGETWNILTSQTLDPYKNEYVIERMIDL